MTAARQKYKSKVSWVWIRRALSILFPIERIANITPGDENLVYCENSGYEARFIFVDRDGRLSALLDAKGLQHLFYNTMIE